ncbi:speckle-type POZ protein-like [Venturia canescens]|uniref:speckle-type POZ protein-like n=1 Tax=Venturia canescens TaxID=32260 RepID=UPI001C9CE7D0|nr:speckle-type POZ protein-like [Venturia canescens]
MAKRIRWQETNSRANKHITEFEWTLHDWSLLYDGKYKDGVHSQEFKLDGTNEYMCKLSLEPTKGHPLTITFSNTMDILTMCVKISITNMKTAEYVYTTPFEKNFFSYYFYKSFDKYNKLYLFNDKESEDDTLTILVQVTIIKTTDTTTSTSIVAKSCPVSSNPSTNILANFKSLLDRKTLSDITFVLGDKELLAHKAILAAQSKVFEKMFVTAMREKKEKHIEINDTEVEVFEKFLNFLYTGSLNDVENNVEEMLMLADYYEVSVLKTICENLMLVQLCEENVVRYVILADRLNCGELKHAALSWIRKSPTIFEKTFREESQETLKCLKEILSN